MALGRGQCARVVGADALRRSLRESSLLSHAKGTTELERLVEMFSSQSVVVVDVGAQPGGLFTIRSAAGQEAKLPSAALEPDVEADKAMMLQFEATLAHDCAASTVQDQFRKFSARAEAKRRLSSLKAVQVKADAEEKVARLSEEHRIVCEAGAERIQAAGRGFLVRLQNRREAEAAAAAQAETEAAARDQSEWEATQHAAEAAAARAAADHAKQENAASELQARIEAESDRAQRTADGISKLQARTRGFLSRKAADAQTDVGDATNQNGAALTTNRSDSELEEEFLAAAATGDFHVIHRLFRDCGVNIHATDHKGNTGLMIAAAAGHLSVVNYLLKIGASQSLANHAGWTALHRACFNGRADVVELLLDEADKECTLSPETAAGSEALLNAANHYGSTPLHVALPNGHLAVAKLLVERNPAAPLEARNASGDTPLHFAVVCRQPAIANFLLSQGANASAANDDGAAPLDTAVSTDQPTIVRTLAAIVMQQDVEKAATRKKRRLERTQYKMARSSASGAGSAASTGLQRPRTAKKTRSKGGTTGSKAGSRNGSRNGSRGTAAKKAEVGSKASGSASGKRKALVAQAWKAASLSTCVSLGLRDHELSTILTSLEMEVPGRIDRITGAPPAPTVCAIRLAPSEATAVDLSNCSRALELQPDALVSVGVARKARKRLLGLIRGPEEATLYIEEHPDARSWSPYACRQLLDALQVPSTGNGTEGGSGGGVLEGASGLTLLAVRGAMARTSSHCVRPDQAARHIPESLHSVLNVGAVGVPDSDARDMIVHRRSEFDQTYDAVKEGVRSMMQLRAILKTAADAESAETVLQAFKSSGENFLTATDLHDGARQLGIELPLSGGELGEEVSTALVACVDSTGKGIVSDEDFLRFVTGGHGQGIAETDAMEAMRKCLEAMEAAEAAVALIDALPSVLRHRLLFHCAVLNDLDSRGRAARRWWWMPGPTGARGLATITPPAAAPEEPEVQVQKDMPPADDGGWLSAAQAADGEDLRVQVVHFADLVTAFQEAANRSENHNLPSEVLRDARRAGGARGTVTSLTADGASGCVDPATGSARVVLDDGADVLIPPHCLYVLPMVLVNPAQLRVGSCVRVVQPSWLKQLLLSAGHLAMGSVDRVSKDFGAQEVTVQSLNYPRLSNQRVLVRNNVGAEVDLPVEALLPSAESGASQVVMGKDPSAPGMGVSSSGGNLSGARSSESTLLHTLGRGGGQQGGPGGIG
eukprot:CAMPEP_0119543404 /NCGR_PEP_ID=MMETSP1344-20130328/54099_1 /TAXON_ID=236787 /ORGANISM="Florenciella parvula, Strain CCMP2471" /LENGTH=1229 /DNA_ID=CAMNT_0007587685 /DNA_START=29 /DNA_END=3714 /DNA_ORIENTATION=+